MGKQKLSPKAAESKKRRDLKAANTPFRRNLRADSQKKRRAAERAGRSIEGMDFDHNTGKFVPSGFNRGGTQVGGTDGTKAESNR